VALHVGFARLVLLFGDKFCQLVLKESGLLQVAFFLSQDLRLLIVDSQFSHASPLSLFLDARALELLALALSFKDKHFFVSNFKFAGLRLVFFMTHQGAFERQVFMALFLRLYL